MRLLAIPIKIAKMKTKIQLTVLSLLLIVIDQFTKQWAQITLPGKPRFLLEYSQNPGIAFGLSLPKPLLIILTIILIPLIYYIAKAELDLKKPLARAVPVLIIAGALGNLLDRFTHGFVIDFIKIGPWPNFNFADIYISTAVLLAIVFYGKIMRTKKHDKH